MVAGSNSSASQTWMIPSLDEVFMITSKRLSIRKVVLLSITAVLVIALVISVVIIATLPSGSKPLNLSAALSEIVGVVEVQNSAQDPYTPVNNGFVLKSTMQLQTKEESKVRLDLSSGSIVRLGQSTIFSLESQQAGAQGGLSIGLQAGRVWIILKGGSLDVTTPAGVASVRGSYMSVWIEPNTNRITVTCLEGTCSYTNTAGVVELTSGQKIISSDTNIVPPIEKMDQTDIQSWLDNSPEAAAIVPLISSLLASSTPPASSTPQPSSTPPLAPTSTIETATNAPTATTAPTLSPAPSITPKPTATNWIPFIPTQTESLRINTPKPKKVQRPTRTPTRGNLQ